MFSLAVHSQALWLLAGLGTGTISLQSARYDEGKLISMLRGHKSAVSALSLSSDETSFLSGSWDKLVYDWDLENGKTVRSFEGSGGQISTLEFRPSSSNPITHIAEDAAEVLFAAGSTQGPLSNGVPHDDALQDILGEGIKPKSPADSLFGDDADSLFGDNILSAKDVLDDQTNDLSNVDFPPSETGPMTAVELPDSQDHEGVKPQTPEANDLNGHQERITDADNVFLVASIDGAIRIWDKRKPTPTAVMMPQNVPPWCMNACWSADGRFIYAGRRNGTVDEYDVTQGLKKPSRNFKLPAGSGPVSAVRAMPNQRHLIWFVSHMT